MTPDGTGSLSGKDAMRIIRHYWPISAAVSLLLAVLLLLTAHTGSRYEQERVAWLERLNQTPGIGATWFNYQEGLFQHSGELHLSLVDPVILLKALGLPAQAGLSQQLADLGPLELYIRIDSRMLPGYASSEGHLITSRGTLGSLLENGQLQIGESRLRWQMRGWSDTVTSQLDAEGWTLQSSQGRLHLDPFTVAMTRFPDQNIQLQWLLNGINLTSGDDELALHGVQGQITLQPSHDFWLIPALTVQVADARYQSATQPPLDLAGASLSGSVKENRLGLLSLVDMHWQGQLDLLGITHKASRHELEDLSFGVGLSGIDQQGYKSLVMSAATNFSDTQSWLAALNRVTRSGFHLHLEPFKLRLQQGHFTADGEVTSRPFDMAQLNGLASFRSLLQGTLSIEADQTLTPLFVEDGDQLLAMQHSGFITRDSHGMLNTRLRMVNGKLSANGYKLPW
jgi:hypothetical protein